MHGTCIKIKKIMHLSFKRCSAIRTCAFKTSYRFHLYSMKQYNSHIKSQTL